MDDDEWHEREARPGVESQHRERADRGDLARRDPEVAARQRRCREEGDGESQRDPAPKSGGKGAPEAASQLPGNGHEQCPGQESVKDEDPAGGRGSRSQGEQAGRRHGGDEDREETIEGGGAHRLRQARGSVAE